MFPRDLSSNVIRLTKHRQDLVSHLQSLWYFVLTFLNLILIGSYSAWIPGFYSAHVIHLIFYMWIHWWFSVLIQSNHLYSSKSLQFFFKNLFYWIKELFINDAIRCCEPSILILNHFFFFFSVDSFLALTLISLTIVKH